MVLPYCELASARVTRRGKADLDNKWVAEVVEGPFGDEARGNSGLSLLRILALHRGSATAAGGPAGGARRPRAGTNGASAVAPGVGCSGIATAVSPALMDDFLFANALGVRVEVVVAVAIWLGHANVVVAVAVAPRRRQASGSREWDGHVGGRAVIFASRRRSVPLWLLVESRGEAVKRVEARLPPEHPGPPTKRGRAAKPLLLDDDLALKLSRRRRAGSTLQRRVVVKGPALADEVVGGRAALELVGPETLSVAGLGIAVVAQVGGIVFLVADALVAVAVAIPLVADAVAVPSLAAAEVSGRCPVRVASHGCGGGLTCGGRGRVAGAEKYIYLGKGSKDRGGFGRLLGFRAE